MDAVCQFCCKVYANRGSLTRHLAEKHNVQNVISYDISVYGFKCLENECNRSFKVNKNLIEHLRIEHNVDMREEVHQFDDYEGFRQWLNQMHSHENVEYIQHSGPKIKEDCEILYFNCSRSGKSRQMNGLRKRLKKSSGTTKIEYACTSYIKLVKKQNKSTAFYNVTHYGHDLEIQHLHIPKMEKANIARNLVNGVPITRILDNNRESFCEDKIKRINLLTRKDVHNVKIHHVSLHSTTNILMESECEDTKQINENEIGTHLSTLSQSIPPSNDNNKKLLDTIFSETEKLNTQAASSNNLQVLNHVLSTLKKENMIIKKTQNHEQINAFASSSKSEPANKNIPKQVNFCSTKKRKVSKKQFLQRPSIAERNVILNKT